MGFLAFAIRLGLVFAVFALGGAIYSQLGSGWFKVYIVLAIAIRVHLEIRWIEQLSDEELGGATPSPDDLEPPQSPFRKR
ncbi:MAG: hypothetical protein WBO55_16430 [Rhizobiaceae bacterium]